MSVEFEATAEALDRLTEQLYTDFMALKVKDLSAGNKTATEITAAYEPINQKTDQFEYCVTEFINGILALAGIEDEPTYTRSQMSNQSELLEMVMQCAEYLDDEYVTTKILTLLGDADKAQEVLKRKDAEAADRYKQQEAELDICREALATFCTRYGQRTVEYRAHLRKMRDDLREMWALTDRKQELADRLTRLEREYPDISSMTYQDAEDLHDLHQREQQLRGRAAELTETLLQQKQERFLL